MRPPRESTIAVIPARHASTRFPGKPLAPIAGRPMIEHVVRRCEAARVFGRILVATEDPRIVRAVERFGGEAVLTSPDCETGTDRVAEVARRLRAAVVVNVQGDEPLVHPSSLRALVRAMKRGVEMATLVRPLAEEERRDPAVVKVVRRRDGTALYFSRADIPADRDGDASPARWAHLGLYAYRRETLLRLARLRPTPLERAEKLEQLRALENGIAIACAETPHATIAVDHPGDVERVEAFLRAGGGPG